MTMSYTMSLLFVKAVVGNDDDDDDDDDGDGDEDSRNSSVPGVTVEHGQSKVNSITSHQHHYIHEICAR